MLYGISLLVGLIPAAETAAAQHCPAGAAADACITNYKQRIGKVGEDMRAGVRETDDRFRDLKLEESELARRAREQRRANDSLLAKHKVDILKRCLSEIR